MSLGCIDGGQIIADFFNDHWASRSLGRAGKDQPQGLVRDSTPFAVRLAGRYEVVAEEKGIGEERPGGKLASWDSEIGEQR